jgi:hypothetical protein
VDSGALAVLTGAALPAVPAAVDAEKTELKIEPLPGKIPGAVLLWGDRFQSRGAVRKNGQNALKNPSGFVILPEVF